MNTRCRTWWPAVLLALLLAGGCVERTVRIESRPPGAVVVLNDEELPDVTPAKTSFLWYGDYDIVLRKPGYQTLKTHVRIDAPWYELPPFDLISECFVLGTIHDDHTLPPFELLPAETPAATELIEHATETRAEAVKE